MSTGRRLVIPFIIVAALGLGACANQMDRKQATEDKARNVSGDVWATQNQIDATMVAMNNLLSADGPQLQQAFDHYSDEVDRLNTRGASLEAMRQAVVGLSTAPDHVLVDAFTIPAIATPQTPLVGGDARDGSIAAASIVATVYRDARMCELEARHPGYGFAQHKGYATREHIEALARLGPCPEHRKSFTRIAQLTLFA